MCVIKLTGAVLIQCKWKCIYNPTKCVVIIFGKDTRPHNNLTLGIDILKIVNDHEHVGTMFTSQQSSVWIHEEKSKCNKRPGHAIMAIGSGNAPWQSLQ